MKQIEIGTCVPGYYVEQWLPAVIDAGFECFSINFHMELGGVDLDELALKVKDIIGDSDIRLAALGYYCNPIMYENHKKTLEKVIDVANKFNAPIVGTFAGAYEGKPVEDSMKQFGIVFRDLAKRAADNGVKLAIENCPMEGTWQSATCNIGFNPRAWEMMFNEVPDDNFGLEWEPTHQMVQLIDPVAQLRQWVNKVIHMHGKDATIDYDAIKKYGVAGATDFVHHRTPGFGDVNWTDIISILRAGGYDDDICIEGFHDPVYNKDWEMTGQIHALNYLKWCRGGDFVPNP